MVYHLFVWHKTLLWLDIIPIGYVTYHSWFKMVLPYASWQLQPLDFDKPYYWWRVGVLEMSEKMQ